METAASVLEMRRIFSKELWEGMIPIEFTLSKKDLSATVVPEPYYCCASRFSYLPAITEDVVAHFRTYAVDISSTVWFEHDGVPLKSNLPIGCLFDMMCNDPIKTSSSSESMFLRLPWKITIHFRYFPADKLFACSSREESEKYYMHSLKQGLFILYSNLRSFSQLSKAESVELWESVCSGNRLKFDASVSTLRGAGIKKVRKIPVRIMVRRWVRADSSASGPEAELNVSTNTAVSVGSSGRMASSAMSSSDKAVGSSASSCSASPEYRMVQVSVPVHKDGNDSTAPPVAASPSPTVRVQDADNSREREPGHGHGHGEGEVSAEVSGSPDPESSDQRADVQTAVEDYDENEERRGLSRGAVAGDDAEAEFSRRTCVEDVVRKHIAEGTSGVENILVRTHGVEIPHTASVYDVWELYAYADMFVYLVVDVLYCIKGC